jgi:hypothetical protein
MMALISGDYIMNKKLLLILLSLIILPLSIAADQLYPSMGSAYGVKEDRSLSYECHESGNELITCDFVVAAIRYKVSSTDINKKIEEGMQQFEAAKEDLLRKDEGCDFISAFVKTIDGEASISDYPEIFKTIEQKEMAAKYIASKESKEFVAREGRPLLEFCNNPTKDNHLKVVTASVLKDSKTCYVSSQKFQQTFKRVEDFDDKTEIWTVNSEPTGVCGTVDLSRFERVTASGDIQFWNYYAKKSVTNKKGEFLGVQCSQLDEEEYEHTWVIPDAKYLGCDYIEFSY